MVVTIDLDLELGPPDGKVGQLPRQPWSVVTQAVDAVAEVLDPKAVGYVGRHACKGILAPQQRGARPGLMQGVPCVSRGRGLTIDRGFVNGRAGWNWGIRDAQSARGAGHFRTRRVRPRSCAVRSVDAVGGARRLRRTIRSGSRIPTSRRSPAAGAANTNHGDYEKSYQAVIDDLNKHGGINGRKVVPVIAGIDPLGTAPAQETCLKFTEDDPVFAAVGFFNADVPLCYAEKHDTPVLGGQITDAIWLGRKRRGSPSTRARRWLRG